MGSIIAVMIAAASWYSLQSERIRTDFWCMHLLWAAWLSSAIFLCGGEYISIIIAMLFAAIAGIYWTLAEFMRLISQIEEVE